MCPADEQKKIFSGVYDQFKKMQLRHSEQIAGGATQEVLLRLHEERGRLFNRLQEILDKVVGGLSARKSDGEHAEFYVRAVGELLEGEGSLHVIAALQKERLQHGLQKMRCGKKSLLGYRLAASGCARPRFLSSKT